LHIYSTQENIAHLSPATVRVVTSWQRPPRQAQSGLGGLRIRIWDYRCKKGCQSDQSAL